MWPSSAACWRTSRRRRIDHLSARPADAASCRVAGAHSALPQKLLKAVPVIVGPTGIGKSRVAFELALRLNGEIVVADSRQVYKRLDIATNKPSDEQRRPARYHLIEFVDPSDTVHAAQ